MADKPLLSEPDHDIEQRFRAAGIVIPPDRLAGTYAAARRLLGTLHWLRQTRTAAAEPAHMFLPGPEPKA